MKVNKKKKTVWKIILVVIFIIILLLVIISIIGMKSYVKKDEEAKNKVPGNAAEYSIENIEAVSNSPLQGKNILFLGSSVTYGSAGTSFADYLGKLDGVNVTKEAVSGTTLVDEWSVLAFLIAGNGNSYVSRLKSLDEKSDFDAVICQLSTNDASSKKEMGEISDSVNLNDFDTKTVTGAIEYIICYVQQVWDCPVIFYTGSYYESEEYSAMVKRLMELQEKWDIDVINMYDDEEFNAIDQEVYDFYMHDEVHPTKAGYLEWWVPMIEEKLYEYLT